MKMKKIIVLTGVLGLFGALAVGCGQEAVADSGVTVIQGTDLKTPQDDASQAGGTSDAPNSGQENPEEGNQEGRWHVLPPEVAEAVDADFCGEVWKLGEDSVWIVEEHAMVLEDGSLVSSSPSSNADIPDSELIQVVFDADTHFYVRTIFDGGKRHEDSEAGFGDLEEHADIDLRGSFRDDVFYATEVRINKIA